MSCFVLYNLPIKLKQLIQLYIYLNEISMNPFNRLRILMCIYSLESEAQSYILFLLYSSPHFQLMEEHRLGMAYKISAEGRQDPPKVC